MMQQKLDWLVQGLMKILETWLQTVAIALANYLILITDNIRAFGREGLAS